MVAVPAPPIPCHRGRLPNRTSTMEVEMHVMRNVKRRMIAVVIPLLAATLSALVAMPLSLS